MKYFGIITFQSICTLLLIVSNSFQIWSNPTKAEIVKNETRLIIKSSMPEGCTMAEIRIKSDRNKRISSYREISPANPDSGIVSESYKKYHADIWYPVVDVVLQRGMKAVAGFLHVNNAKYILNGPFFVEKRNLKATEEFSAGKLFHWENSVFIEPETVQMKDFYITMPITVVGGKVAAEIELLSQQWSGQVEVLAVTQTTKYVVFSEKIAPENYQTIQYKKNSLQLDRKRLLQALDGSISFIVNSQINDKGHPANGGLYLFYDLDAKLYRSSHWVWGWGPSVSLLLKTAEQLPGNFNAHYLQKVATEIGEASLNFIFDAPGQPVHKMMISRWDRGLQWENGYAGAVTPADALFMVGWAWAPLYRHTADKRYLDASIWQSAKTDSLFNQWVIPPHSYYFDKNNWSDWVIDETGFGVEGYAGIYEITKNTQIINSARQYIDRHCQVFEQEDGLWARIYYYNNGNLVPSRNMTRGLAWAFEGLLAAHRMMPESNYLGKAEKMAHQIIKYQLPNGAWSFKYNQQVDKSGYSEKGTAIWSYFLYRLYSYTKNEIYLQSARRALIWCLNSIYDGPDLEANGSIVGLSEQSGVGYRQWFNVSCTYTSAFFGLAILEELKLSEK